MLYIVLFTVVGVLRLVIYYFQRASRRADIIFMAKQYGYKFQDRLTLLDFADCEHPPWETFPEWDPSNNADEVLILRHAKGDIFSFNMYAHLNGYKGLTHRELGPPSLVSIIGMRVNSGEPVEDMAVFAGGRKARNEVRLAARGNCLYAMIKPTGRRSLEMGFRERIVCMRAMTRLLDGQLDEADALFEKVSGDSFTRALIALPLIYLFCYYLTKLFYTVTEGRMALLIVALIVGLISLYTVSRSTSKVALKHYF
jgi:hypothetical protein